MTLRSRYFEWSVSAMRMRTLRCPPCCDNLVLAAATRRLPPSWLTVRAEPEVLLDAVIDAAGRSLQAINPVYLTYPDWAPTSCCAPALRRMPQCSPQ